MKDNLEEQWEEIIDNHWEDLLEIEDAVVPRFRAWHDLTQAEIIAIQSLILSMESGPIEFRSTAYQGLILTVVVGPSDVKKMADLGTEATNEIMTEHFTRMYVFFTPRSAEELEDIARIVEECNNEVLDLPTDPASVFGAMIKKSSQLRLLEALQRCINTYEICIQEGQIVPNHLWLRINSLIYTLLEEFGYPADEYIPGYYDPGE